MDYLWTTARAHFGDNNHEIWEQWIVPLKNLLWDGKVETVITKLSRERMKNKKHQNELFQFRGCLVNNKDCMNFDMCRKKEYFIGSGDIESVYKYIVADRLKRAGMRWALHHSDLMIWLRCKYYEKRWNDFCK